MQVQIELKYFSSISNKSCHLTEQNILKISRLTFLLFGSGLLSSSYLFCDIKLAEARSCDDIWNPIKRLDCERLIIKEQIENNIPSPTPPVLDPSQSNGAKQKRINEQAQKEADAILAEKRAKQKAINDAINKANAETLARQEAEAIAAKEAADNIKRQEEEEKLANQQRDEKERNDKERELSNKRDSELIQAGGDLLKKIFNIK